MLTIINVNFNYMLLKESIMILWYGLQNLMCTLNELL